MPTQSGAVANNPLTADFVNIGGDPTQLKNGISVYKASNQMVGSLQSLSATVPDRLEAEAKAMGMSMQDACCGDTPGGCGFGVPWIDMNVRKVRMPRTTGLFNELTESGWAGEHQVFYETPRFSMPASLCCTNDFPLIQEPSLCCDKSNIATYFLAWRTCIMRQAPTICGPNGPQRWDYLETRKQELAFESMRMFMAQIAMNGDESENILGLANNPRIPTVQMVNLLTSTPQMVLKAIANVMAQLRSHDSIELNADGSYATKTFLWIIPSAIYDQLTSRFYLNRRLIDWIEGGGCCDTADTGNRPLYRVKFVPIPELNNHGVFRRSVGYIFHHGELDLIKPKFTLDGQPDGAGSDIVVLPPQADGLFQLSIAWFRMGSVVPKDIQSIVRTQF
jgi:Uncharacterized protein conserved in bacteria (DUF2184)